MRLDLNANEGQVKEILQNKHIALTDNNSPREESVVVQQVNPYRPCDGCGQQRLPQQLNLMRWNLSRSLHRDYYYCFGNPFCFAIGLRWLTLGRR